MVIARGLPAEAMRIGTCAAIVAIVGRSLTAPQPARHLSIECIAAAATDHEALEHPARSAPACSLALAILLELHLSRLEKRLVDQCGNWDLNPLFPGRRAARPGSPPWWLQTVPNRTQPRFRWHRPSTPEHGSATIDRIADHSADGGRIPPNLTGPRHTSHFLKPAADFTQAYTINANPAEDRSHDAGFVVTRLDTCNAPAHIPANVTIPKGCAAERAYRSGLGRVATAAAATFKDFGAFVLSDHALNLKK
jgi:hypothetical protein